MYSLLSKIIYSKCRPSNIYVWAMVLSIRSVFINAHSGRMAATELPVPYGTFSLNTCICWLNSHVVRENYTLDLNLCVFQFKTTLDKHKSTQLWLKCPNYFTENLTNHKKKLKFYTNLKWMDILPFQVMTADTADCLPLLTLELPLKILLCLILCAPTPLVPWALFSEALRAVEHWLLPFDNLLFFVTEWFYMILNFIWIYTHHNNPF